MLLHIKHVRTGAAQWRCPASLRLTRRWVEGSPRGLGPVGPPTLRSADHTPPLFLLSPSLQIRMSCPGGNNTAGLINRRIFRDQDWWFPVMKETLKSSRTWERSRSGVPGSTGRAVSLPRQVGV